MDFTWIVLISALVTAGVIYGIYFFTRPQQVRMQPKKKQIDVDTFDLEEDFFGDVEAGFEDGVSLSVEVVTADVYPDCFGSVDKIDCNEDGCSVFEECRSTVKVLKGF
ncbi:hypothetical protein BMS3Bbin16_01043 [archaeon BMS3Bbin16]|nr:hypothetical protein BMS3Bbin16_01043 [archaeon BMS3Bbin16]